MHSLLRLLSTAVLLSCVFGPAPSMAQAPTHPGPVGLATANGSAYSASLPLEIEPVGKIGDVPCAIAAVGQHVYVGTARDVLVFDVSSPNNPTLVGRVGDYSSPVEDIAVDGEIAYVAAGASGLRIIDVSDASQPHEVSFWAGGASASGVCVVGRYAYVAHGDGLAVVDVLDPANPTEVGDGYETWGWTAHVDVVSGTAYVATGWGLDLIDVADPLHPQLEGTYSTEYYVSDVRAAGGYAYVTDSSGLQVVDVSNPLSPTLKGSLETGCCPAGLALSGHYAYVGGAYEDVLVIDVMDPGNPRRVAAVGGTSGARSLCIDGQLAYVADALGQLCAVDISHPAVPFKITGENLGGESRAACVDGRYAYMGTEAGLSILDVSDRTHPRQAAVLALPSPADRVVVCAGRAYVTGWYDSFFVVDVSDPQQPALLGSTHTNGPASGLCVAGGHAFVADNRGLLVLDVSEPAHPVQIGEYLTPGTGRGLALAGNTVYLAAGSSGLRVLNVSDPTHPSEIGAYEMPETAERVCLDGGRAYVIDGGQVLHILDVSDPSQLHELGSCAEVYAVDVRAVGPYAYVSDWWDLHVLDVSDPAQPLELGSYSSSGQLHDVCVDGQYAYIAESSSTLSIIWAACPLTATVTAAGGMLDSAVDRTVYTFAPDTFASAATVTHHPRCPEHAAALAGRRGIGHVFEVSATYQGSGLSAQPSHPYTLTVGYSDAELGGLDEDSLALCYWDGAQWVKDGSSRVDKASNRVTATPDRLGLWTVLGGVHATYLPVATSPGSGPIDLSILGLEVTQSVQNRANNVPLVAGRPAMVRVYARTNSLTPTNGIYVELQGERAGLPLPGSPLMVGPWAAFPAPWAGQYGQTFNFALPTAWLSGTVRLVATVDPGDEMAEGDEGNNTASVERSFTTVPPLAVRIVPINYTCTATGKVYPAVTADLVSDWLRRGYPVSAVNVSIRAPIAFAGDLSQPDDWGRLLDRVTSLKQTDRAPDGQVYYGLIPTTNPAGDSCPTAYGGLGWVGLRAAIGLAYDPTLWYAADATGEIAAHEIGHNFGRWHVDCGNPGGIDTRYPYREGSIGQFGFDLTRMRIWTPGAPDLAKDLMSYCGPKWLSDYTYKALYADQRAHGAAGAGAGAGDCLLVRATLGGEASTQLLPAYVINSWPEGLTSSSDYVLAVLGEAGEVIARYPVLVAEASELGIRHRAIYARVPLPSRPAAALQLLRAGRPVATRPLVSSEKAQALGVSVRTDTGIVVHWAGASAPALVRYTVDDGLSWTTVGLDALGGELRLDGNSIPAGARLEVVLADTLPPARASAPAP